MTTTILPGGRSARAGSAEAVAAALIDARPARRDRRLATPLSRRSARSPAGLHVQRAGAVGRDLRPGGGRGDRQERGRGGERGGAPGGGEAAVARLRPADR